jgi:hypothetical protein
VQAADSTWRPDQLTGVCHSRSAPPVHMSKLTATQKITPYQCIRTRSGEPRSLAGNEARQVRRSRATGNGTLPNNLAQRGLFA